MDLRSARKTRLNWSASVGLSDFGRENHAPPPVKNLLHDGKDGERNVLGEIEPEQRARQVLRVGPDDSDEIAKGAIQPLIIFSGATYKPVP